MFLQVSEETCEWNDTSLLQGLREGCYGTLPLVLVFTSGIRRIHTEILPKHRSDTIWKKEGDTLPIVGIQHQRWSERGVNNHILETKLPATQVELQRAAPWRHVQSWRVQVPEPNSVTIVTPQLSQRQIWAPHNWNPKTAGLQTCRLRLRGRRIKVILGYIENSKLIIVSCLQTNK